MLNVALRDSVVKPALEHSQKDNKNKHNDISRAYRPYYQYYAYFFAFCSSDECDQLQV